jgi:hypothetical protein
MENIIKFDLNKMGSSDIASMNKVINAYREVPHSEHDIFETGFNLNTGYVYIALENNIQICSCFGQDVEYLVYDYETGEEHWYDTYEEAFEHDNELINN